MLFTVGWALAQQSELIHHLKKFVRSKPNKFAEQNQGVATRKCFITSTIIAVKPAGLVARNFYYHHQFF